MTSRPAQLLPVLLALAALLSGCGRSPEPEAPLTLKQQEASALKPNAGFDDEMIRCYVIDRCIREEDVAVATAELAHAAAPNDDLARRIKEWPSQRKQLRARLTAVLAGSIERAKDDAARGKIVAAFRRKLAIPFSAEARFRALHDLLQRCGDALTALDTPRDYPLDRARAAAAAAGVVVKTDVTLQAIATATAQQLNASIKEFHQVWAPLGKLRADGRDVQEDIDDACREFVLFNHAKDLSEFRPYVPISPEHLPGLMRKLERFALRHPMSNPDKVHGPPKGAAVAWAWSRRDLPVSPVHELGKDSSGLPERQLLDYVVEDMLAAWGTMEPAKSVRIEVVRPFAEQTSLTVPSPTAMLVLIIGSVVLVGGLVLALVRAVRSPPPAI